MVRSVSPVSEVAAEPLMASEHGRHMSLNSFETVEESKESYAQPGVPEFYDASSSPPIRRWPSQPRTAHPRKMDFTFDMIVDVILALMASLFLLLAILAASISGRSVSSRLGWKVEEASRLGPTIFPIVFAAIASRAIKVYGRLEAERGTRLGKLHLLFNSQSMFSALLAPITQGAVSITGVLLLLYWLLSPLGGQASLRVLPIDIHLISSQIPLRYMDTGPASEMWIAENIMIQMDGQLPPTNSVAYSAALMQGISTKLSPQDAWGNVKIPRIENLTSTPDQDGWMIVGPAVGVEQYSSLFGIPIAGLPLTGNSSFNLESSYLDLACPEATLLPGTLSADANGIRGASPGLIFNCTDCLKPQYDQAGILRTMNYLGLWDNMTELNAIDSAPRTIQISSTVNTSMIGTSCSVTTTYVEAEIQCANGVCHAAKVRRSLLNKHDSSLTSFDYWAGAWSVTSQIGDPLSYAAAYSSSATFFLDDADLMPIDRNIGSGLTLNNGDWVDLRNINKDSLGRRASMLINTFTNVVRSPQGFAGSLPPISNVDHGASIYGPALAAQASVPGIDSSFASHFVPNTGELIPDWMWALIDGNQNGTVQTPFIGAAVTVSLNHSMPTYRAAGPWLTLLFLSSILLVCTSVLTIAFRLKLRGSDMFDPVMAMTIFNPYLKLPQSGSFLDTSERIGLLRSLDVRLGDAEIESQIGVVALGRIERTARLSNLRRYK